MFDPVSPPAESIKSLFFLVLAITGVIFVLVQGALLYFVWKYRETPASDASEPPQTYGSRPIEVAWTVAPLLTVFVLFLVVVRSVLEVRRDEPPTNALRVKVIGHQWWWEYRYPGLGVVTANELHVPISTANDPRPIHLELESADVIHSFWVPRLAGKTDVIPGRTNRMWFQVERTGRYQGQCGEYCGNQHANMSIEVVCEPVETFRAWIEAQKKPANDLAGAAGRTLFLSEACANCHTIQGTPAKGTFGPDLTHLMSRSKIGSGVALNDHGNLLSWVDDPQHLKPGCLMPSLHLGRSQVEGIVAYLETLR